VRLGESDLTTEYDCLDPEGGCHMEGKESCFVAEECADKYQDIGIEMMLMHPRYSSISDNNALPQFDVALLVLSETVKFSDYISPVCLPEPESEDQMTNLVITGWGNTNPGFGPYKPGNILQKLDVINVPLHTCDVKWKQKQNADLLPSHICVNTFEPGKSSCRGDSGGPLVRLFDVTYDRWELAGVISFSVNGYQCGNVDLPVGLTRVAGEVNQWLRDLIGEDLPVRERK